MVEKLAREYLHLVDEGWSPDLEEFLGRVPKDMRDPCRAQIDDLMKIAHEIVPADAAEPQAVVVPEPEPEVEPESAQVPEPDPEPVRASAPEPAPVPAGPQLLSKEEAMAMWGSQG